ncbi:acetate uptake transporter [Aliivibrio sp. S4TY2]|uniref:Acetate uptake transporter n=1 Tax=Aliivibrio finisterrensis TaxID=511998 RepID=A0A4Q5KS74_9GAMM|nr:MULTISPECIES: GPR1/FUN34/YaaH family transporter [Aliivibrio]MDD9156904.1 acetate uptake transporter [Aliivibrio sp. S4TY2]MDD9160882.1 acetate uptake transporter [Aliivibrio sp. S4TY1]MDD9164911.1 acetate uptake transporter [Aliivibrio sp. S4MY2]MDD9168814.1 acetate uptake transporter [Aliivibrio sp. S4MY4]MDD9178851.1 acetate uptake transporter [Aliivibrio sp. A6]
MSNKLANPAPLGLMAFGMTTVLLNLHNAGFFPLNTAILSMGIFYGGIAQVIAGIMEYKKGNTFGTTAFTSYGFFWLSLVALILMPEMGLGQATSAAFMGWYLAMWGVLTFFLFLGTFNYPRAKQVVFGSLTILFALLSARDFTGSVVIGHMAGYVGLFCGLSAMYFSMAQVINGEYGRTVLPVGEMKAKEAASVTA